MVTDMTHFLFRCGRHASITLFAASIVAVLVPGVGCAQGINDNFTQDSSLNSSLFAVNGPVASDVIGNIYTAQIITPTITFSPSLGLGISTPVFSSDQGNGIQTVQSFTAPFIATATAVETAPTNFVFAISSASGATGIDINGGLFNGLCNPPVSPPCFTDHLAPSFQPPTGGILVSGGPQSVPFTFSIGVDASGNATASVSSGGTLLGQATVSVGSGPFYVVFGQGSGEVATQGQTYWSSLRVSTPLAVSVNSNHLVDQNGNNLQLRGVNSAGTEFMCVGSFTPIFLRQLPPDEFLFFTDATFKSGDRIQNHGFGIFDGMQPNDQYVEAMTKWGINAVRISLNEDCWLDNDTASDLNGVIDPDRVSDFNGVSDLTQPSSYGDCNNEQMLSTEVSGANAQNVGTAYRQAIVKFVNLLNAHGIYAILNLHWNAPGSFISCGQQPMADADYAPAFWTSVAETFKNNPAVIFDLYNEPFLDLQPLFETEPSNGDTRGFGRGAGLARPELNPWNCWLNGCWVAPTNKTGVWQTAGMQELVDAVRNTGATQPIMLGGLTYAGNLGAVGLGPISHTPIWPADPLKGQSNNPDPSGSPQLIASYHSYCGLDLEGISLLPNILSVEGCKALLAIPVDPLNPENEWTTVAKLSTSMPVVTGEFGEYDCSNTYVTPYMNFADGSDSSFTYPAEFPSEGISYLGWAWVVASGPLYHSQIRGDFGPPVAPIAGTNLCNNYPALLQPARGDSYPFPSSYLSANPSPYGEALEKELQSRAALP
jgi:hypothetical protein